MVTANGRLRPTEELREVVAAAGLSPTEPIITYCTVGARWALAWFAPTHCLGFEDVRVYDGSWVEWGFDATTPIERGR